MELLIRIKAILLNPQAEWPEIAQEKGEVPVLFVHYVAILALVPALAHFIGASLVGFYAPVLRSLAGAVVTYVAAFAFVYVLALVIDALAPVFGARKSFASAFKLSVYCCTPVWLAGAFLLVPGLSFLVILGLYGLYLLGTGLPVLMQAPAGKTLPYTAAAGACALVLAIGLGLATAPLFSAPA